MHVPFDVIAEALLISTGVVLGWFFARRWMQPPSTSSGEQGLFAGHGIQIAGPQARVEDVRRDMERVVRATYPRTLYHVALLSEARESVRKMSYFARQPASHG